MRITKIDAKNEKYTDKKIRVAAYARVSTSEEDQLISLEAQKVYYEEYIKSNPEWLFAGLYYDEGITATKVRGRFGLIDMLEDCKDKKIDLVITKSISRFARNTIECLEMTVPISGTNQFISQDINATFNIKEVPISQEEIIPYVPADASNPTSTTDANIPTQDEQNNKIDSTLYNIISFKTEDPTHGNIVNVSDSSEVEALSMLVKKDLTWSRITVPSTAAQAGYDFWKWTPEIPSLATVVEDQQVYVASFIKDGQEVNPDDVLPEGYNKVTILQGSGIADDPLFAKTYAVKTGSTLSQDKFPTLTALTGYKDPAWNVANPWEQVINSDQVFSAAAVSSVFDVDNITAIEYIKDPADMDYIDREELDLEGIQIKLTDANGNEVTIGRDDLAAYGVTVKPSDSTTMSVSEHDGYKLSVSVAGQSGTLTAESIGVLSVSYAMTPITPVATVSITPKTQEVTEGSPIQEISILPEDPTATVEVTGLPTGVSYTDGKITGTPEVTDWGLVEETRDIKVTVVTTNEDGSKITKEVVITVLRDTDKDGTPDTTDEDDDNDGFTDVEEIEKGSDPKDPNSIPQTETEAEAEIETETEVETPVETETEKETDKEKPVDEGNEHNPNTGDNFNSVVYIGLASVALIALVIMRKNNLQN